MNTRTLFLGIFAFLSMTATAQPWMQNVDTKKSASEEGEFYLIQDSFNEYWEGKTIEKGKGWKQFKRWENFMEPRVYPQGELSLPSYNVFIQNDINPSSDNASWTSLGPHIVPPIAYDPDRLSGVGRLNVVAFHPSNADIMWAGAPSGGIWKTINGGISWTSHGDNLVSLGVSDIAVNPVNPDIIYIATGDGDSGDTYGSGILKSIDGGLTWNPTQFSLDVSEEYYFRRLLIDPTNPDILYAASNKGVYRTDDGFDTYTRLRIGHFKDLEFHPTDPQIVYAAEFSNTDAAKIIRIKNNPTDIDVLFNGLDLNNNVNRVEIAVSADNPDAVFALGSAKSGGGFYALYKSIDQGENWTKIYDDTKINLLGWDLDGSDYGGQGWYDLSLAVDPSDEDKIFVGGVNIWESTNGGANFSINAHWVGTEDVDYVHADHHMIVYSPLTSDLFSCHDGGLHKSVNNGADWVDISEGFSILQIYKTSASQSVPDLFLTGNQDNGSFMHQNGEWTEVTGGDGMDCLVHPTNPDTLITSYYFGTFWISHDGGETFYGFGPRQERGKGAWVTPLLLSDANPEHIFVAYENIYKSEDYGESWIQISNGLTVKVDFKSISVSPTDENYIYASTYSQSFRTKNGGISWEETTEGLPAAAIKSTTVSPNNPEKVWISVSGFLEGEKVFMSEDAGDTWVNYSEGLPNIPTNVIKSHIESDGGLYLGTDHGVYYRDPSKTQWELYNNGLPNVIVNDIEFQENQNRLIAGTYGRGLWTSPFYPIDPNGIYGEIIPIDQYACLGDIAKFAIESTHPSDSVVWNFNDEVSITAYQEDTVDVLFQSSGAKNITANIWSIGVNAEFTFNSFFEVKDSVTLELGTTGIDDYHGEDPATLFVSGANTYEWTSDIAIETPNASSISVSVRDSTTFYITGRIGSCEKTDSIRINVIPGPENDKICDAIALQYDYNGPFTNVDASTEINEPLPDTSDCNTQTTWCNEQGLQNSVWFTYVAVESITTFITDGFDTQIAIYDAINCDSILEGHYTLLAANDDYFGSSKQYAAAINQVVLEVGKEYWIQVDGSAGGDEGEFDLWVFHTPVNTEEIEVTKDVDLSIFPNPSEGGVNIQYYAEGSSRLEIYDLKGRKIADKTIDQAGFIQEFLNINEKGLYFVRVKTDKNIYNRRLIIQ